MIENAEVIFGGSAFDMTIERWAKLGDRVFPRACTFHLHPRANGWTIIPSQWFSIKDEAVKQERSPCVGCGNKVK